MERIRFDITGFREYFEGSFKLIYPPNDDSEFLVNAVEKLQPLIRNQVKPTVCLEIGCGSGYIINTISKHFGPIISKYYATDINPVAIETTLASGRANGVNNVHVIMTNLVDDKKTELGHKVDLLVTNPPFEPSPLEDISKPGPICAWSAGPNGRAIIDCIIDVLPGLMSNHGVVLMCCVKENGVDDIRLQMKKRNFFSTVVIEKTGSTSSNYDRNYHQYVLAFSKTNYWQ